MSGKYDEIEAWENDLRLRYPAPTGDATEPENSFRDFDA